MKAPLRACLLCALVSLTACEPVRPFSLLDGGAEGAPDAEPATTDTTPGGGAGGEPPGPATTPAAPTNVTTTSMDAGARDGNVDDAGADAGAGRGDAGPVMCNGELCSVPSLFDDIYELEACCYEERLCGVRIVDLPAADPNLCAAFAEAAAHNDECPMADPAGVVYDHGCCLADGTCGARLPLPDDNALCVDPASVGLPKGTACSPDATCAGVDVRCVEDGDCCGRAPFGAVCSAFSGQQTRCTSQCSTHEDCLTGCCIEDDDGVLACAPGGICLEAEETP